MKNLLAIASVVSLAMGVSTVQADTFDEQPIDLSLEVAGACVLGDASATEVDFGLIGTEDGFVLDVAAESVTFGDSYCNAAHKISLTSEFTGMQPLVTPNVFDGDFDTTVHYVASVSGWSNPVALDTSSPSLLPSIASVGGAYRADTDLEVSIAPQDSANPVVAGVYTDTLTLEIALAP